jgi:hypothetical protein
LKKINAKNANISLLRKDTGASANAHDSSLSEIFSLSVDGGMFTESFLGLEPMTSERFCLRSLLREQMVDEIDCMTLCFFEKAEQLWHSSLIPND